MHPFLAWFPCVKLATLFHFFPIPKDISNMRTVLILNPTSGTSMMAENHVSSETSEETILAGLRTYGIEPEVWYTTHEDAGEGLATKAADEHVELVIAAGGD